MKSKQKYITFIYTITLAICILTANQSISATAKSATSSKKLNISRSSMNMKPNTQKKLTIRNAHKKVKWSSSNRKIAVITSKTGKHKNKAVIRAKKAGTCTITVKSGSIKRKCKVRVLEDGNTHNTTPNSNIKPNADTNGTTAGIEFETVSATENSIAVTLKMYNNTKQQIYYGLNFSIEKQTDGKWTILETKEPRVIPAIACLVKANSFHSQTFQINDLKNPVTNGNYRITLPDMSKSDPPLLMTVINSATFQITDRPDTGQATAAPEPSLKPSPEPTLKPSPKPTLAPAPGLPTEKAIVKMTLSDIRYSDNILSVKMLVQNNTTAPASLSRNYSFEKWEDDAWQPILPKEPLTVTCDMILLPDYGESYEEVCTLIPKEQLTAGTYRLVRPGIFCEDPDAVIEKKAEFVIQ